MKISDLIGKKVSKIRFMRDPNHDKVVSTFQAQIKLSDGNFILFPTDSNDSINLTNHYEKNKFCNFNEAKRCGLAYRLVFRKKQIVDVHFKFMDGEQCNDEAGIIELENGKFLLQHSLGPLEHTDVNFLVLNRSQFEQLKEDGIALRSFKNDLSSS